jgi:hypothetical protein
VCFISVFPWGTEEEHYHPRCEKREEIGSGGRGGNKGGRDSNYWQLRQRND